MPEETGTEIPNNIQHARKPPELLDHYMHDHQIHLQYDNNKSTAQNWEYAKKTIHYSLWQVYPIKVKNNTGQIWEQKGYEHATH